MSYIKKYIEEKNKNGEKVLSVFLTAGFPTQENFSELALKVLDAGADMLEIGFPFSDPLADGPVIQNSSQIALNNGINLEKVFDYVKAIRTKTDKPLLLMGYANPVLHYGIKNFADSVKYSGANGIIIPDVPIEEYDNFYNSSFNGVDKILLITPTTSEQRIKIIDKKSSGFIYCVSVSGTTGVRTAQLNNLDFIKNTFSQIEKNKMLVGFGISKEEDVKNYSPYCNGVIVGSAVIKSLESDDKNFSNTLKLVNRLKTACK